MLQPCQDGSGRPRLSFSSASATAMASIVMTKPLRQTDWPEIGQKALELFGRPDNDEIGYVKVSRVLDRVEAYGDARACIPHQQGRMERRSGAQKNTEGCNAEHASTAAHLAQLWRMSQALCRALVYGRGSSPATSRLWI